MEAPKAFDPYEVIGVITPGTVPALLLTLHSNELRSLMGDKGLSIGDLGLFLVLAFVLGQMLTAIGWLVELVVFVGPELPTDRVRMAGQRLLSEQQAVALEKQAGSMEGAPIDMAKLDVETWRVITSRMAARVRAAGRSQRYEIQNRTYGMARGLAAAFAITAIVYAAVHHDRIDVIALAAALTLAAVLKMRSAGKHYARALFLEFLDLDVPGGKPTP